MRTTKRLAVNVERDSVRAGDDIDAPHAKRVAFQAKGTLAGLCNVMTIFRRVSFQGKEFRFREAGFIS